MAQVNPTHGAMADKLGLHADNSAHSAPQYDYGHDARDKVGPKPTIAAIRRTPPAPPHKGNHDRSIMGG